MLASYYSPDNGFSKRICTFDHSELNNVVFVEGTQASLEIPRRNLAYGVKADVITWRGIRITVLDALKLHHPRCQSLLKRTAQLYP